MLALIAAGHSNAGIAEHLGLTTRTVETHTSRIFTKLDLEAHPSIHRRVLAAVTYHRSEGALVAAGAG
ncbi:MAG: LuxR C-terminal-related transcriptional regulator [Actinomycetota bacterium]|nr:LuxR C-terminal-related transcriptional regulator [Actinomycetota bacterium]